MTRALATAQARLDRRVAWQSPGVGVLLGLGLTLAARLSTADALWPVIGVVLVAQALLISGLHRGLQVSAPVSGMAVAGVVAVAADVVVARADEPHTLEPVVAVVACAFLLAVVQQLARRDERHGVLASLAATVGVGALAAFVASWAALGAGEGSDVLTVAGLTLVATSLARLVPSEAVAPWVILAVGLGGGAALGPAFDLDRPRALLVGLALGVATALADAVVRRASVPLRSRWWTTGALAFAGAAPLAYVAVHLTP